MAGPQDYEPGFFEKVFGALSRWLGGVRGAVFRNGRDQPNPSAVYETTEQWNSEVDALMPELDNVIRASWENFDCSPYISANAFAVTQLALTQNLLVRVPDEVYHLIFAELEAGYTAGETVEQIAERVDRVLSVTDSERWPGRARTIARTEIRRAWNNGELAAALYCEPQTGRGWTKIWESRDDDDVRNGHELADNQARPLSEPFDVGGEQLMYPLDPTGSPSNVINCRCSVRIRKGTT